MKDFIFFLIFILLVLALCFSACLYGVKKDSIDEWHVSKKCISSKGILSFELVGVYTRNDKSIKMYKSIVVSESIYKAYSIGDIFDDANIQFV